MKTGNEDQLTLTSEKTGGWISDLLNINQFRLINLSYSDVMLGCNGESPLWATHTNVSCYTIIINTIDVIIIIILITKQYRDKCYHVSVNVDRLIQAVDGL